MPGSWTAIALVTLCSLSCSASGDVFGVGSVFLSQQQSRRSVLLDWGARNADSLTWMVSHVRANTGRHTHFDVAHAFEARPTFNQEWKRITETSVKPTVNFYNFAVWTENTTLTFSDADYGSSAVHTPQNEKAFAKSMTVQAIDIDAWLRANVRPGDDVTLKVDIEMAEVR